ncbi:MAG: dihydroorotate dehydrogenase [Candidatus Brocadia sp. WS118]|nr:MAG: dihydroorotate dehydrogenase [Candidatus Brocadia sp. WS118]
MSVIIVGGDHLGSIPKELDKIGITEIQHLTGRTGQKMRGKIPEKVDFIILLYDFVNHNLAYKVKKLAINRNIPIIYAKRSWSSIYQKIKDSRITIF